MAKKSGGKSGAAKEKPKGGMSAEDHRKAGNKLSAQARVHHAKADLADALNPPKKPRGYPY